MEIKSNEVSGTAEKLVTRVSAFVAIGAVVGALAYVGVQGYRALTDSFVAPIILGPDNDVVIASKLTVSQLESERAKVAAEAEAVADDLLASEEALARLQALKDQVGSAMDWTSGLNAHLEHGGRRELRALARERSVLTGMIDQERLILDYDRLAQDRA